MLINRVFLVVLDSYGIGNAKDAEKFNDKGSNTLKSISKMNEYSCPNLEKLGLFNIDGVDYKEGTTSPLSTYARLQEASNGKDTTIGHWEIAGIISENSLPVYPNGFPSEVLEEFTRRTGKNVICNKPYSGTDVIKDYGKKHIETGDLIVYTSADSVFQIAAHESVVPIDELYRYCEVAREILQGEHAVGRVIARPFEGEYPFERTPKRHDYSLLPPRKTMLSYLQENGFSTIGVGKIYDIFAGIGISETTSIKNNAEGMEKTINLLNEDFNGLCFINLVDFDMVFGHRNDVVGYAKASTEFDKQLGIFMENMRNDDILIITADHGCDPSFAGTDHTREDVPLLIYGNSITQGVNLGTRNSFADIGKTILSIFGIENSIDGTAINIL